MGGKKKDKDGLNLYNEEHGPLRKKDKVAFYKSGEKYIQVPSMFGSTAEAKGFVKMCMNVTHAELGDSEVDKLWNDAENIKPIILEALEILRLESEGNNEPFKVTAYRNAINSIKKLTVPIVSGEQASKLKGIGPGIAAKIDEVVKTGKLRTLEERTDAQIEHRNAMETFLKIWGVGQSCSK